jgi:DNA-binding response OmpR family regulator
MAIIILVVARHHSLRRSLGDWLSISLPDCHVLPAASTSEATYLLGSRDVRLVVVDVHEPWGEGLETIRSVRAADPDVPLIALGLEESHVHRRHAREAGATSYVAKSKLQAELVSTVQHILATHKAI